MAHMEKDEGDQFMLTFLCVQIMAIICGIENLGKCVLCVFGLVGAIP